jgi:hypothetical protein
MIETTTTPRKRRIFPWAFLALQLVFVAWIITGIVGAAQTDCGSLDVDTCNSAKTIGGGIGIVAILFVWVLVDVIVYICRRIYVGSKRKAS